MIYLPMTWQSFRMIQRQLWHPFGIGGNHSRSDPLSNPLCFWWFFAGPCSACRTSRLSPPHRWLRFLWPAWKDCWLSGGASWLVFPGLLTSCRQSVCSAAPRRNIGGVSSCSVSLPQREWAWGLALSLQTEKVARQWNIHVIKTGNSESNQCFFDFEDLTQTVFLVKLKHSLRLCNTADVSKLTQ